MFDRVPHQEYLSFLREIEKNARRTWRCTSSWIITPRTNICELDAGSPHGHGSTYTSLQPYASWLNQVEIWFNRITQRALRRGTFSSVKELVEKIDHYVQNSNRHAQPLVWTATADSIFAKV